MRLLEFIKEIGRLIKNGFTESKIAGNLSKQPVFFYVFIVAFLIIRYALIYNNNIFAYKGMMIFLYSIAAFILLNFARDLKTLLKEETVSKMSFLITGLYHLAQIAVFVLLFLFVK